MPVQNSQDLDARFAIFLNPIRDLTKNWEVDIAKYLEEYLVELSEIQITFDGGETTMNFAEAAMLIQGSATVYSKKVEFLWQMVLQMLDLLSSKRSLESRADNSKGGEGGRHKQVDLFIEFEKVEKLCDGKTINMKDDDEEEEEEMKNSFKFLPEMPLHLVEKESEKSLMKIVLYLKNKETFGNKDDFRINRSYLTPSGLLYLDLPPEILKKQMHVEKIIAPSADDSIAGFLHAEDETLVSQNIMIGVEENMAPPQEEIEDLMGNDNFDHLDLDSDHPSSPEMPPFDPLINVEVEKNPFSGCLNDDSEKLDTGRSGKYGLRSRNAPKEVAPKVKLTEPLKPLDPHLEAPAKRPIRAGRIRKPLPCMCHREPTKAKRNRKSKDEVSLVTGDKILPSVESFITRDLANLISNNNNDIKNKVVDSRLLEELTSEESKRQEKCKKKKVKELMNNENNLTLEEIKVRLLEEAQQQNKIADRMADDLYDDHIPDLDLDDLGGGGDDDLAMPNPHNNDVFDDFDRLTGSGHNRNLNDSALYEPGSDYEALVQKWVSDYIASAQEHIASSELTRRVNKWRKIITPKLQEEEERQAFDIHSYGSHILDHFPDDYSDNILFEEVAHGKSSYEVSRLFLSCLMLTNTYNIELSQTREGDLEMDCLQLKLLSKVRHHKEMEENLPPSVKKKKSKQDKRKKQVSSDDENVADNISSIPVAATNQTLKAKNPKKLKVTEKYSNI